MKQIKRTFGNRMVKFVDHKPVNELLGIGCPWSAGFSTSIGEEDLIKSAPNDFPKEGCGQRGGMCELCREFITTKYRDADDCPCAIYGYGRNSAMSLARKAVNLWKSGKHKWQSADKR